QYQGEDKQLYYVSADGPPKEDETLVLADNTMTLYLPKDGEMVQVSEDHSRVGRLQRTGQINERQARNHPQKNVLYQVLGGKSEKVTPQVGRVGCEAGDRFLICSDGLNDGMWDRRIDEMARQELCAKTLVDYAVAESGRDNTTAMLIEVQ
ncbi:MAG: PP2C family protein-serine/threonine phosphatase, partial [Haloferula sp.]